MNTTSDFPTTFQCVLCFNSQFYGWGCHGLTAITYDSQLLHGGLWGNGTQQGGIQAHLLVPLFWHHIHDVLMDQNNWMTSLTTSTAIHPNIQCTMETESDDHLPFLDTNTYITPDDYLGHTIYRKPTHTNLYLNGKLHHYLANKHSVLSILA